MALLVFFAATTPTGIIATKISRRFWRSVKQFTEETHRQFLIGSDRPTITWGGRPNAVDLRDSAVQPALGISAS